MVFVDWPLYSRLKLTVLGGSLGGNGVGQIPRVVGMIGAHMTPRVVRSEVDEYGMPY